jgi:cell division transport system permease protein
MLATFLVVGNTIKLAAAARRDEVEILQWVGASEEVIQAPFVIEGMIQGIAGGALALTGLGAVFLLLQREMATMSGLWAPLDDLRFLSLPSMGLLLAAGCLVGAVGSLVSLRRFLRTWHVSNIRT